MHFRDKIDQFETTDNSLEMMCCEWHAFYFPLSWSIRIIRTLSFRLMSFTFLKTSTGVNSLYPMETLTILIKVANCETQYSQLANFCKLLKRIRQCNTILLPLSAKMCQSHPFTVRSDWVNEWFVWFAFRWLVRKK